MCKRFMSEKCIVKCSWKGGDILVRGALRCGRWDREGEGGRGGFKGVRKMLICWQKTTIEQQQVHFFEEKVARAS